MQRNILVSAFEERYELEKIREQQMVPKLKYTDKFLELGIIEPVGRTRGTKYILSHKYKENKLNCKLVKIN